MKKVFKRAVIPIVGGIALGLVLWSTSPIEVSAFQDAKAIYGQKCAACHGVDGAGATPMGKKLSLKDLKSKEVQSMPDAKLLEITSNGKGKMPGYEKSLGAEKCKQLVAFIRQMAKK
jgi:mono/diheme cytochrome c family protein